MHEIASTGQQLIWLGFAQNIQKLHRDNKFRIFVCFCSMEENQTVGSRWGRGDWCRMDLLPWGKKCPIWKQICPCGIYALSPPDPAATGTPKTSEEQWVSLFPSSLALFVRVTLTQIMHVVEDVDNVNFLFLQFIFQTFRGARSDLFNSSFPWKKKKEQKRCKIFTHAANLLNPDFRPIKS